MSPITTLLSLALLAESVLSSATSSSAPNTLAFRKRLNLPRSGDLKSVAHVDRARIAELSENILRKKRSEDYGKKPPAALNKAVPVTSAGVAYLASVGVGSPPTQYG